MNSFQNYGSYHPINNSSNNATHEYIDCEIINNSTDDLSPIPVIFNNVKTRQIINDCSDYYLSVVRWSLDSGLPQIIPQIDLGGTSGTNTDINQTIYRINIGFDGGFFNEDDESAVQVFTTGGAYTSTVQIIEFEPENLTVPVPSSPPTSQDEVFTNEYYYTNSVGNFLHMVNEALRNAFAAFIVQYKIAFPAVNTFANQYYPSDCPHFDWDGSLISLNCGAGWLYRKNIYLAETPGTPPFNFYITMNTPLYNLFNTFPSRFINSSLNGSTLGSSLGANYALMLHEHQWEATYTTGSPLIEYFVFNQEGSSVPSWSPVSSIVFQTSTIPINPTQSGAPVYAGKNLKDSIQASGISNILTDFQIPLDRGDEYTNALLYYTPSSEYRLFDMNSNGALKDLNIQIYWKDKLGFIHPFLMKNGASASLKLLLRKKSFNGL